MSSVIEEFLCLHSTKSTPNIQSIWDEIRKEVDPFDEHRIKRALSEQIQKNQVHSFYQQSALEIEDPE